MGSYDDAETCEMLGSYILLMLADKFGFSIGLYRDDGLAAVQATPCQTVVLKKFICETCKNIDLKTTIEADKEVTNYLDIVLDLRRSEYCGVIEW